MYSEQFSTHAENSGSEIQTKMSENRTDESKTVLPAGANDVFPPGLNNAFLFSAFNALSFQIVLGSPMILYQ